ncbi:MAG TPA: hypothetical protein DCQ64_19920 [Candidatus Rokubacteria bacterium]|nr:hypothetical protein [Candidatus Rokubacteria bacterium]
MRVLAVYPSQMVAQCRAGHTWVAELLWHAVAGDAAVRIPSGFPARCPTCGASTACFTHRPAAEVTT